MKHDERYMWMDLIRGLSAVIVCTTHLRAVMFVDFSSLETATIFEKIFYFMTGFGHQAVMIFFVLSGFFVGGSILKNRNNFHLRYYLLARLSRLWVVLIPMLCITFIADQVVTIYLPQLLLGEYQSILSSGPTPEYSTSLGTFFANILFLQTIYSPVFGTNGPLWSLANEFWYYIMFPLVMISLGKISYRPVKRMFFVILLSLILFFVAGNLLEGFAVWLLGVAVYLNYSRSESKPSFLFMLVSASLFITSLVVSKLHFIDKIPFLSSDILIALCFSLFLISIKGIKTYGRFSQLLLPFAKWLSNISFTMYLLHFPLIMLIYTFVYSEGQVSPSILSVIQYILWLVVIVISSYIMWWAFERHTPKIRNYLSQHLIKGS